MWKTEKINLAARMAGIKHIAVIGAGGKSSLIAYLAERAALAGRRTAITTTTRIWADKPYALLNAKTDFGAQLPNPLHIGTDLDGTKLTAVSFDNILEMGKYFDTILVEADGAKMKPLKFPNGTEPVIPPFTELVLVVAGLDSLLGRVEEKVFRWELLQAARGIRPDEVIDDGLFLDFFDANALLKGTAGIPTWVILNKYDAMQGRKDPLKIARAILERTSVSKVIISSLHFQIFYAIGRI